MGWGACWTKREKRKSHKLKHRSRKLLGTPSPAPNLQRRRVPAEPLTPWHLIKEQRFISSYTPCNIRQRRRCLISLLLNLGFLGDETARGLVDVVCVYIFSFPEPGSVSAAGRKTEPAAALSHAKASGLISRSPTWPLYHLPFLPGHLVTGGGNLSQGCKSGLFPVQKVPGVQVWAQMAPTAKKACVVLHWGSSHALGLFHRPLSEVSPPAYPLWASLSPAVHAGGDPGWWAWEREPLLCSHAGAMILNQGWHTPVDSIQTCPSGEALFLGYLYHPGKGFPG